MTEREHLLLAALKAAHEAGGGILEIYGTDFEVELKSDRSPLTLADRRSQESIHASLAAVDATVPFLGEEGREIPYEERAGWKSFWLVDPLDGTKEFVSRNGEFTINITLVEGSRAVLGVVFVPVKALVYFSLEGLGAFRLDEAGLPADVELDEAGWEALMARAVRLPCATTEVFTVAASRSHMTPETEAYIERCRERFGRVTVHSSGSSLKLCHVAEGVADVYPRIGPTFEWDVAAGQAVIEAAGGVVLSTESGEPLRYNKESLLNPAFLCVSSRCRDGVPAV